MDCMGAVKREWFQEENRKVFKAYKVDHTEVYHILKGQNLIKDNVFSLVVNCLAHCIAEDIIT